MGADVVISADGLGKRYQLGEAPGTDSLREALAATFSRAAITRAARALTTFGRVDTGQPNQTGGGAGNVRAVTIARRSASRARYAAAAVARG